MAEWINNADKLDGFFGHDDWLCPVCGHTALDFVGGTEDWYCRRKPNYCPFCGERMDGNMEETPRWFSSPVLIEPALEKIGVDEKNEKGEIKSPQEILAELGAAWEALNNGSF
jgi:hypothetical protein